MRLTIKIVANRLSLPGGFDIMGMITVFIDGSQSIIDSGFSNALIREKILAESIIRLYFNLFIATILYIT